MKYAQVIDTWIYKIECQEEKEYDFWNTAMKEAEKETGVVFLRVLDDDGSTEVCFFISLMYFLSKFFDLQGKIVLSPTACFKNEKTWKKKHNKDADLLIPGLKRLSKQLHVDFAYNVHEGGKRMKKTL